MSVLKTALAQVVVHKIDSEHGEGVALSKEFAVQGHPTFVLVRADGATLERWWGYGQAAGFVTRFNAALQDPTTIDEKRARFDKKPTLADAEKLAEYHVSRDEVKEAVRYYREAQKHVEGTERDFRFKIFETVFQGSLIDQFDVNEVKRAADAALAWEGLPPADKIGVARMVTMVGRRKDDHEIMVPYLERAVLETASIQDERVQLMRRDLLPDHALFVDKDKTKAVQLKKETLADGWAEKADELNGFAWWCFENEVNLEEAESLARKGVLLAPDAKTKAAILDTVAEICNARGNCKEAVQLIEQAIQADPESPYYPKQLERFRKILSES